MWGERHTKAEAAKGKAGGMTTPEFKSHTQTPPPASGTNGTHRMGETLSDI